MDKILPANRKFGIFLDCIVLLLVVLFPTVLLLQDNVDNNSKVFVCFLADAVVLCVAIYFLRKPCGVSIPVALNFVADVIVLIAFNWDYEDIIMLALFFLSLFVFFAVVVAYGDRFRSVVSEVFVEDEEFQKLKYGGFRDIKDPFKPVDTGCIDAQDNGSFIFRMTNPKMFGMLVLLYGIVLVSCNAILDGGAGNIVGFALFAAYGAYILHSEKDYSIWGRFKYVHRFILVFGLAYVVRGILGGGEIDRVTSIIEGVILILLASYMSEKVYRMASGTRHPFISRLLYTLVWLVVVILLIFFVIGAPVEIVSQFNEGDLATGIANIASGIVTFAIMTIVLLYFILYCRPKQMYYEVDENEDLRKSADYYNENVEEYTVGDAIRDSRIEKKRLREEQYAAREAQKRADDARRRQAEEIADSISHAAGYGVISAHDREKIISEVMNSSDQTTASDVVDRLSSSGVDSIKDNASEIKRKLR